MRTAVPTAERQAQHVHYAGVRAPVLYDLHPPADRLHEDVLAGLSATPRRLPCKYFYDEAGAALFERITRLEAYYPTRTELGILRSHMEEIAGAIGARARIVEFGSGSGLKTQLLLRGLAAPAAYVPVDIARAQLRQFAGSLARDYPALEVLPVCADYTRDWALPPVATEPARTVAFFPGSTIGNFEAGDAVAFLGRVRRLCGPGGGLLIGADLHKDRVALERAYDDPEGVTAAFNLNLLQRINRECGADFDTGAFRHHAFYDERRRRIEMRLLATRHTTVTLPPRGAGGGHVAFEFQAGDSITTEYSHKYTPAGFRTLARAAGWSCPRVWTDERRWFSVWLMRATS
jgi:dimethylhistidine N-methyltransferase